MDEALPAPPAASFGQHLTSKATRSTSSESEGQFQDSSDTRLSHEMASMEMGDCHLTVDNTRLSREFSESRLSRDFSENQISFDLSEQRFLLDKRESSFSAQSSRDFEEIQNQVEARLSRDISNDNHNGTELNPK